MIKASVFAGLFQLLLPVFVAMPLQIGASEVPYRCYCAKTGASGIWTLDYCRENSGEQTICTRHASYRSEALCKDELQQLVEAGRCTVAAFWE